MNVRDRLLIFYQVYGIMEGKPMVKFQFNIVPKLLVLILKDVSYFNSLLQTIVLHEISIAAELNLRPHSFR